MPSDIQQPSTARQDTDESLRTERERADQALEDELSVDETADAVITKARERADEVLAAARAKTDRRAATPESSTEPPKDVAQERRVEDRALFEERAEADEVLRLDRAAHVAALSIERAETDRHLSSERGRSDDALAMRDEFLGIVSHELRNQLSGMSMSARLIEEAIVQENRTELVLKHAQRIQRTGVRMGRLIGDLIDVASIDAGQVLVRREIADPTEIVTEAVQMFQAPATTGQIALVTELVGPLTPATLDSARILQVLINLLSNAIKFTPANGTVVIRCERQNGELRFSVRDTGEGIPTDKLDVVFERFVQVGRNDRRGVGLGLYISKCIVHGHNGQMWAESGPAKGSTFVFTIPPASSPGQR
jgi:signal transduction histidine kinase